tara:strand:- start:14605 stop:15150 length:546 start_codon:yes stop_codon:yes gene_type:complete
MFRALFLDRDGVINYDDGYTFKISKLKILDGVIEGLQAIKHLNFKIIIVTNQSGLARGLFTIQDFHGYMNKLIEILESNGISICDYFYCPHHVNGVIEELSILCKCRKPHPGMILKARDKHNIDLSKSILIGDKKSDIEAGIRANIPYNIMISNSIDNKNPKPFAYAKNLIEASKIITKLK